MDVTLIIAYILLSLSQIYLIVKFARQKQNQYLKATVVSYVLFSLFLLGKCIFSWYVPDYVLILAMLVIFINDFFGYGKNLYNRARYFDRSLHVFGAFTFALFLYYIVLIITAQQLSTLFRAIFIFFLGVGAGGIFEVIEFLADMKKDSDKSQKGLVDTDVDLICDIIGSVLAALFSWAFMA